jgi:hypothetical protein
MKQQNKYEAEAAAVGEDKFAATPCNQRLFKPLHCLCVLPFVQV